MTPTGLARALKAGLCPKSYAQIIELLDDAVVNLDIEIVKLEPMAVEKSDLIMRRRAELLGSVSDALRREDKR